MDGSTSFLPQLGLMQPARWVTSKELHLFLFMVNETVPVCDIHYSSAIHSNRHKAAMCYIAALWWLESSELLHALIAEE